MAMFIKMPRLQKKYISFFAIVPLLVVTALIKVDDPVCGGTGVLTSGLGMESVLLTDTEAKERTILRDACTAYILYNYDVTLSLTNEGPDTAEGFVKLALIDFERGKVLDTKYTVVEIPGGTSLNVVYNVWFETGLDEALKTDVNAVVLLGEIPDETCNGTGKISLNTWFLVDGLKNSFEEIARAEQPFTSPVGWQWEEEQYANE